MNNNLSRTGKVAVLLVSRNLPLTTRDLGQIKLIDIMAIMVTVHDVILSETNLKPIGK